VTTLSAIVLTLNEAANIETCLESVKWVDEIIVVDSGSTDSTVAIAKKYTDKVVFHPWEGYSAQRNFAHSLVHSDYILSLDADEVVPSELRDEIQKLLQGDTHSLMLAYRIPIRDWMFGRFVRYGSWPHQKPIRLYRRGVGIWQGEVHEALVLMEGAHKQIGELSNPLYHYSHPTVATFVEKLNRYTDIEADQMFRQGRRANLLLALAGAVRAFGGQYIRQLGFRDGGHGLILALLMAFYYFLVRAKLWSLWYLHEHPAPPKQMFLK